MSTQLWAKPSKEWVIQPKPKPGRKPKHDANAMESDSSAKGRRTQNRAAQRAFRERRQSQLADLQTRIQSYELGEIERNVALQNVAKKLKEENEALRSENNHLRERLLELEISQSGVLIGKKRCREELSSLDTQKRCRLPSDPLELHGMHELHASSTSSNSHASSPSPKLSFSSLSVEMEPTLSTILPLNDTEKLVSCTTPAFTPFNCGLCTDIESCVCRQINEVTQNIVVNKMDIFSTQQPCDLSDLPAFQPAIPLPRKSKAKTTNSVFQIHPSSPSTMECSGDPSNCMACADDSFGKAFCDAVGKSAASCSQPCDDCPSRQEESKPLASANGELVSAEMMPTNAAWQQFKSHPNIEFSDLELLADVVAGRSKCGGPQVITAEAPDEPSDLPPPYTDPPPSVVRGVEYQQAQAGSARNRSPPPQLVPQEVLLRCAKRNIRQVQVAAVQDALRYLDGKYPH